MEALRRLRPWLLACVLATMGIAGCGSYADFTEKTGPDGRTLPRTIKSGTVDWSPVRADNAKRPLTAAELRALEVFFQAAELHEPDKLYSDAICTELTLDGVVWCAYHNGLFQKSVGSGKQLHVKSAPRWATRNNADMDVLVEWARKQNGWREP